MPENDKIVKISKEDMGWLYSWMRMEVYEEELGLTHPHYDAWSRVHPDHLKLGNE